MTLINELSINNVNCSQWFLSERNSPCIVLQTIWNRYPRLVSFSYACMYVWYFRWLVNQISVVFFCSSKSHASVSKHNLWPFNWACGDGLPHYLSSIYCWTLSSQLWILLFFAWGIKFYGYSTIITISQCLVLWWSSAQITEIISTASSYYMMKFQLLFLEFLAILFIAQ